MTTTSKVLSAGMMVALAFFIASPTMKATVSNLSSSNSSHSGGGWGGGSGGGWGGGNGGGWGGGNGGGWGGGGGGGNDCNPGTPVPEAETLIPVALLGAAVIATYLRRKTRLA